MVDTHVVAILDSMDDLDPASLFLRPGQDLEPVALDSAVYDSVNGGVTERTLDICIKDLPNTPVSLAKATSRQFHRPGKPGADHDPVQSNDSHHYTDEECNGTKSQAGVDFGAPDAWEKAGERDLEQRVFCIDQPSIFDSFFGTSTRSVLQSSGPADRLKTLTKEAVQKTPSGRHPSALRETQLFQESSGSDQDRASRQQQVNLDSEAYGHWNRRTVFGSLSHPAGAMSSLPGSHINGEESEASELEDLSEPPSFYREPVDLVFELPALSKRPRDILDEQLEIEGLESTRLSSQGKNSNQTTGKRRRSVSGRLAGSSRSPDQKSLKSNSKDLWRDAGKPMEQDTTTSGSKGGKAQLSWETGSKVGLLSQIDVPFVSPYITEAGTDCFEAIYQKHTSSAFRSLSPPVIVPHKELVENIFLLLGGTSSSLFAYKSVTMKFQLDKDPVRIEGCSQASITSLLEDLMNTGTHMRRLINVAETCINGTDDMSLIRIAFGRSLSSYLTFLQGTFVSMRDSYRGKRVHVPGLYHRMSGVAVLLERLSLLFCCHHTQDMEAERVSRLGFYIPPGPDLLSMLYDETTLYSMSQDSLWISLLQSLLDHASKPYRDIISRWLGITPSAPSGANRSQSSTTRETQLLGIFNTRGSAPVERYSRNDQGEAIGNQQSMFSVFDIHLQQSLQSLDLYGEFFVESKHSWSWDGSDPILLGEPLDYNLEFQRSAYVKPAAFIDDTLADQTVDAGKELQILIEYEPRHPLIAHDRNSMQENSGIKWFYAQDDISKLDRRCAESRHEVLKALTTRLRRMGWIRQLSGVDHRDSSLRNETLGANDGASIPFSAQDMIDVDPTPEHFDSESMIRASTERRLWKDLEMDPALAGFFSHSATVGNFQEMAFACPDMMSFLLEPLSTGKDSSGPHSSFSATNKLSLLDVVPPLTVLADYSLKYSIRARTSLIHTCVLSLYFHDLNLRGYFDIVGRFLLMRDGSFRARLSEALFDEETGLLFKAVYAANNPADHNQTSTGLSMARHKGKKWPPRTGELEMALRAVLLDSLQPVTADSDIGGGHSENETQRNHSQTARSQEYDEEGNRHGSFKPLDRTIDPQHLEEILAFAVREYDDKDVVCQDANALEALDFLYLDYRPPRPLRLLPLTSSALGKYTQLFTFQLRLARVGASLKQMYRDLRHRHIDLRRFSSEMESSPNLQQAIGAEMAILHRFRFEAQQIFDGLQSYMTDIALGSTWQKFMRQLLLLQQKVEHRIVGSKINPTSRGGGVEGDSSKDWSREDPPFNDGADKESMDQGPVLENLSDLHKYHEHILDLMLAQSFLLRKQAPVLGIVYSLLDDILQLCQFLQRLALPSDELLEMTEDDADMDQDEGGNSTHQARIHTRIERLKELHRDFRSHCQTLIRVLRRLDERGIDVGNAATLSGSSGMHRAERPETVARTATLRRHTLSTAEPTSTGSAPSGDSLSDQFTRARYSDKETITGFAPQLLLRLDISGFNSN